MKFNKKKVGFAKGFIGPIGDDLPSLIPIMVSLLLFFTIFSATLNAYNSKNSLIKQQSAVINISRELRGESIILDYAQFEDRCNQVISKSYGFNYMVAIYKSNNEGVKDAVEDFSASRVLPDGTYDLDTGAFKLDPANTNNDYFCGYVRPGSSQFSEPNVQRKKSYSIRFYPVALQTKFDDHYVIIPAILAMVVWQ